MYVCVEPMRDMCLRSNNSDDYPVLLFCYILRLRTLVSIFSMKCTSYSLAYVRGAMYLCVGVNREAGDSPVTTISGLSLKAGDIGADNAPVGA